MSYWPADVVFLGGCLLSTVFAMLLGRRISRGLDEVDEVPPFFLCLFGAFLTFWFWAWLADKIAQRHYYGK